ncbi:phosphoenolpyruvate--protein phosphotransferase [Ornithinimicrobium faecis]|uniref:Phosphocarrier protein HPr n=1 Tax=Ornithinimicrobium faecis TaxID=2934158 RepID=A0ABY4YP02_9MICO|nr:phosphoenolpyruvate--protein phosphotransferase [Ornithinimicrobium sp. HY1793]USQ78489.1 phosphoenolpyruvate--protein phosphotransferase [Ornithinimicrobium sp. HY1793]
MIGIVVVSHSRALAEAAVALAGEMIDPDNRPAIKVAAGLDAETFGTDAAAVAEAIGEADSGDGVLVLLDLGSAVLSAEMALEFVDPDVAERVRLSSAPLIEGLVGAAVAAGAGADLEAAAAEAEQGLVAKSRHLGAETGVADAPPPPGGEGDTAPLDTGDAGAENALTRELAVHAPHGLHARPAARFVSEVGRHRGVDVQVRNLDTGSGPVDGRSLTGIATLDAQQGHRIEVSASGSGAADLLDALESLAQSGFGDLAAPEAGGGGTRAGAQPEPRVGPDAGTGTGTGATAQAMTGPTFALEAAVGRVVLPDGPITLDDYAPGDVDTELAALDRALGQAARELTELVARTTERVGADEAAVFQAHLAMLGDPALDAPVRDGIRSGQSAPAALRGRVAELRGQFEGLTDPYQRERGADVTSVGERLLRALSGVESGASDRSGVLVVQELDPATAVLLDPTRILGVITIGGGSTGHGVLLARARGLPVLTGASAAQGISEGTLVAFDVRSRRLEIGPDLETRGEFESLLSDRSSARRRMLQTAAEPAVTIDGHEVLVKANLASIEDASLAAASGADGSGLVRTEALFGDRATAPSVAEQVSTFERISEELSGATITIRTWDVGGDKPLPFHPQQAEANPFLGQRGLRAFRGDATLLIDQLEAICRVARESRVRVMFPMVTTVEEVNWALARLDEAAGRLPDGRPDALEVGIMIEVPAAALRPEALSTLLDFVSIGSNDLVQYTLAAERGNPALAELSDVVDPAVLQLIRATVTGVAEGIDVCLCGDAASDPDVARLLVGLGVTELSATAASVPGVKDALRRSTLPDLQDLAARALVAESAGEVRDLLRRT